MRLVLLVACATLVCCGQAEARYQWLRSDGQPCEVTCRKPVSVADNGNAYVCAGPVKGAPLADVRSGMIGAGVMPQRTSESAKTATSAATAISEAAAIPTPPPKQPP